MYRKQRLWYHQTREKAIRDPDNYLSCIGDGMAQIHNSIPSYSRSGTATAPLTFDTHYQGMITHGKRFTIYRTFGNVGKGTNVAVHAWLKHLEHVYKENGRLPDTLFLQIDGGGENANSVFPGMAELLIHWGLTKRIVLTRLPVGHTHEDIDGKFGVIWNHNKMFNILTPQRQAFLTKLAFACLTSSGKFKVDVEDVYAVPDYRRYISPYAWLERVFKTTKENPLTQLQFIIEKVPVSEEFPLGARTMYRAYATPSAVEIVEKSMVPFIVPPLTTIALMALRVDAILRPTTDDNNGGPEGARVMNCFPQQPLQVEPFKQLKFKESADKTTRVDCKSYLERVVWAMERHHGAQSQTTQLWRKFAAKFPKGTADDYVKESGTRYSIPFKEFFDRGEMREAEESGTKEVQSAGDAVENDLIKSFSTACARWGHQGKGFSKEKPTKVSHHAREFYPGQGLSGVHFLPPTERVDDSKFAKKKKMGRSYKYWNKDGLRTELEKRKLDINGTNAVMAKRLEEDDVQKGIVTSVGDDVVNRDSVIDECDRVDDLDRVSDSDEVSDCESEVSSEYSVIPKDTKVKCVDADKSSDDGSDDDGSDGSDDGGSDGEDDDDDDIGDNESDCDDDNGSS